MIGPFHVWCVFVLRLEAGYLGKGAAWYEYDGPRTCVLLGQRSGGEGAAWFLVGRRSVVRTLAIFGAFCEYWSGVRRDAMESYDSDTKKPC